MVIEGYSDGSARYKFICKSTPLSRIMAEKMEDAHHYEINLVPLVSDLNLDFIAAEDIKMLVSLLLDNAFKSCKSFSSKQRVVEFRLCQKNDFLLIYLLNPSLPIESEVGQGGTVLASTSKRPQEGGLSQAVDIINKYEGNFKAEYKSDEFVVKILIPIPPAK